MRVRLHHIAIMLINGAWYAIREMHITDLQVPDIREQPHIKTDTVKVQFRGELKAADRITNPISVQAAEYFNLTKERLNEINEDVILQNRLPVLEELAYI